MESDIIRLIIHVAILHFREMFSVPEITAFCILWRTPLLLLPTNSFSSTSKSRHHPPNTSIMILYCFTSYPWYYCLNCQRSSPYFVVFSSFFFPICHPWATHLQLDDSSPAWWLALTRGWNKMRASTLLALTSWCPANGGTSHLRVVRPVHWFRFQWRVPSWHWIY